MGDEALSVRSCARGECVPRIRAMAIGGLALLLGGVASAAPITSSEIHPIPAGTAGSGNGTLDLRLMTFSGSEVGNSSGSFNGDNANTSLPQGGGADIESFSESYVTTAGELQAYYNLNFGATTTGEITVALFLDLNETGAASQQFNSLSTLDIILNPTTINGNPDASLDVTAAEQNAIDQIFSGGTAEAFLSPGSPVNLSVNAQGAGFADHAFLTGIDPFALNASYVLLFNVSMDTLNDGAEEIFLSGSYSAQDVQDAVDAQSPEPSTVLLVALGLAGLATKRRLS
jgi:hypothetical protein